MVSMTRTRREEGVFIGAEALCRGRTPFASSEIKGESKSGRIEGSAELYYTPLGMIVRVGVTGLDDGVYSLTLGKEGELSVYLPPLYAQEGVAWCTVLTGKISPSQILGGEIRIIEYQEFEGENVARGAILSPLTQSLRLAKAQ